MKTIKSLKNITTLDVGDVVVFGNLKYKVAQIHGYYLSLRNGNKNQLNNEIFKVLNISNRDFVKNLGIDILPTNGLFPEVKSLEVLTAIVSALFKEYEKQNELPKTWEEFCERNPVTPDEYWIETVESRYCNNTFERERDIDIDKNVCVSLQEAKAFTALMQLRQLRKAYVKDWKPDWANEYKYKYGINFSGNKLVVLEWCETSCTLSFPTEELANQFLNNFKDLLEIAKPLL